MSYVPFTAAYNPSIRTPAYVAAEKARNAARRAAVSQTMARGNQIMGQLITECACTDPAFGGQSFYADQSALDVSDALVPSTTTGSAATGGSVYSTSNPDVAAITAAIHNYRLTPNDILSGSNGFPVRRDGKPWPRPRLSRSQARLQANAFPNFGNVYDTSSLVPPCPCFSSAAPVPITVPAVATPPLAPAPAAPAAPCPYPACSTGNVCLDLVTGCVLNSQIDPAQQTACALANYGVFGNRGTFLGDIIHSCPNPPYLGTPLPNPPQADPSMIGLMNSKGLGGLGQTDGTSNVGGFLAILGLFGIVVWASKR